MFRSHLKSTLLALTCIAAGRLLEAEPSPGAAPVLPPYALPRTVCRVLPATATDRTYELYISLPVSFGKEPDRKYPVILATDGYWSFAGISSAAGGLVYGKRIPESIVVGLSYHGENLDYDKLRIMDLAFGRWHGSFEGEVHADRYLDLIETQVLPLLEKEYRADPKHRYLTGSSAGGLFTLYTMLVRPNLFQGYVADSPAVDTLWNLERAFAASGQTVAGRLFMTSAEFEWPEYRKWIPVFYERIQRHGYVKGGLVYRETPGVRHSAGVAEAYMRGLMYVMEPLAPEHGVATDRMPPPGKRSYVVNFWLPANGSGSMSPAAARAAHEAFLTKTAADLHAGVLFDSSLVPDSGGSLYLDAASRAEVEAIARQDPAVRDNMVAFEVLGE